MKLKTVLLLLLLFIVLIQKVQSQNKSELYELNFHRNSAVAYIPLDTRDYKGYYTALKKKNEIFRDYGIEALDGFRSVSVLNLQEVQLFRVVERCSDCQNYYYLFYKSRNGIIRLIDGKKPLHTFKMLLKLYEKDHITLSENDLHQILREIYFHSEYNNYYSKVSRLPSMN